MSWRRFRREGSEKGSIMLLTGLMVPALVAIVGVGVDFQRASGLHSRLQTAASLAAREVTRGQSDAEAQAIARGSLEGPMRNMGYPDPASVTNVAISRNADGVVHVQVTAPYSALFGALYAVTGRNITLAAEADERPFCVAPVPEFRWTHVTETCPVGQVGAIDFDQEERRTASCASPTAIPTWSAWSATANRNNYTNTCYTPCAPPAPETRWSARSAACPSGSGGSNTWLAEEKRTAFCPSPESTFQWNAWQETGVTSSQVNTCGPACTTPEPSRWWTPASNACPSGSTGINQWEEEWISYAYCAPTGSPVWAPAARTGGVRNQVYTCQCPVPTDQPWWTTPGLYYWTVPACVTQISILAIGGGASGTSAGLWNNGGNSGVYDHEISQWFIVANGGQGSQGGNGGAKQGGGPGGNGGQNVHIFVSGISNWVGGGGGGAGGYLARGGNGSANDGEQGYGGGSGGGGNTTAQGQIIRFSGGGGGTGWNGFANDGMGGVGSDFYGGRGGQGGSNGNPGSGPVPPTSIICSGPACYWSGGRGGDGGWPGGGGGTGAEGFIFQSPGPNGGGGGELSYGTYAVTPGETLAIQVGNGGASPGGFAGAGAGGVVRIIYGPMQRSYPNTNTQPM